MCTCNMDKLGKKAYGDTSLLYRYRGKVDVPPLQMVNNKISASKCGTQAVTSNAAVDTFIKLKKNFYSVSKNVPDYMLVNINVMRALKYWSMDRTFKNYPNKNILETFLTTKKIHQQHYKIEKEREMVFWRI